METNLSGTRLLEAAREMIEDRMGDVIEHMKDPTVVEGKPCTITLKITVTPDRLRQQYFCEVGNSVALSPREKSGSTIHATLDNGELRIVEFNPQIEIPFVK